MNRLNDALKAKRQDNATCHKPDSNGKIKGISLKCLLIHRIPQIWLPATIVFYLNSKRWLTRKRLTSNKDVELETAMYFGNLDKKGIEMLKDRLTKCIELKVDYVE